MFKIRLLLVGVLLALLAVDTASAGLFGHRWERRKAELRAELVNDLSSKMDSDLAREVEALTAQLTTSAQEQVKTEADKLQQQVDQALAQLREEASKLVAAEADRLDKKMAEQVEQIKQQSQELVHAEASKLKEQTDKEVAQLNAKYAEQSQAFKSTIDQEIGKLPAIISQQVEKSMQQLPAKKVEAAPVPAPNQPPPTEKKDEKSSVSAAQPNALPSKEVELVETSEDATSH